ncbi:MAG: hypothetical protein U0802_02005 [Candidatus Binatia bacterium]
MARLRRRRLHRARSHHRLADPRLAARHGAADDSSAGSPSTAATSSSPGSPPTPWPASIRAGDLRLDADSRLDLATRVLPAVGWLHDFQSLSAQLQLPPGWRLLHATGVDQARPTWVATWTPFDLFVVLVTALATARLFGWGWGLLALAAVGLSYTEPDAPAAIFLAVLAAEALVRVVLEQRARARPAGRARARAGGAGGHRRAVPHRAGAPGDLSGAGAAVDELRRPRRELPAEPAADLAQDSVAQAGATLPPAPRLAGKLLGRSDSFSYEYAAVDPKSVVQTGPGLPG